jgi:rod shape-determining protein MreD
MNWLITLLILVAAVLAVFWEAAFDLVRHVLGAQVDLLPPLMVYTSLTASFKTLCLLALVGGLLLDSLSANPLGISVLPLLLVGLGLYTKRDLILRNQAFAQFVLGLAASALVPALTLILLLTTGKTPLIGWGTLWQLTVMAVGGAVATPVIFVVFEWLQNALVHAHAQETSFRPDREIRRGR